jgi:LmbE family N-acetylglucosaminyl deacetylase
MAIIAGHMNHAIGLRLQQHEPATRHAAGFKPSDAGTPDEDWCRFLSPREAWEPETGELVVVSPHPDDEILACGGLIRQWALAGNPVTVLSVTDGEKAYPDWQGLDLIRRRELIDGLRVLVPVYVAVRRIGIPDGAVAANYNRLRNAVENLLRPGATLVAPYEYDGHPDHEATGRVCCEIAHVGDLPIVRYPVWSWHRTVPHSVAELHWRKYPLNADTQRAKGRAMQCFASQITPRVGEPILPAHVLQYFSRPYEAFIL